MTLEEIDKLMIESYYNPTHGLELTPNINKGYRGNENGIVYFASYLMMKDILDQGNNNHYDFFKQLESNCTEIRNGFPVYGLYNRGQFESDFPKGVKRSISHDNISAFSAISALTDGFNPDSAAKRIYNYGLKHAFAYNNTYDIISLPMNPGNYSAWAYNGGSKILWYFFLPFIVINMLISLNKPRENTSSKIIYFIELYPNRNKFIWKKLWSFYKAKMEKQYGKKWLKALMGIYFLPNHPNNLISDLIEEV